MRSNESLIASDDFLVTAKIYGRLFWVVLADDYLLILAGVIIMLRKLFIAVPLYIGHAV